MSVHFKFNEVENVVARYKDGETDEYGHVSVTLWPNGEGFDVRTSNVPGGPNCFFSMTHEQYRCLKAAVKKLDRDESKCPSVEKLGRDVVVNEPEPRKHKQHDRGDK